MVNLISNAIKYSPHGDTVIVSTYGSNNTITLCVQDFGIGIPQEHHSKIFERFQRVGNQDTFGGLGLGLFIASRIIQRHGGTVQVKSKKGKGATFCFTLPIKKRKSKGQTNNWAKEEKIHE